MKPRLGVNIDHVATLRQARGENYPSIKRAAEEVLLSGADQITIHLREDRRHIQDGDLAIVKEITQKHQVPLNLEIACEEEIIQIAKTHSPEWVCLVPEKREERTTEGGLDLKDSKTFKKIEKACLELKKSSNKIKISLFLESNIKILDLAKNLPIEAIEIHTGEYAKQFLMEKEYGKFLEDYKRAHDFLKQNKIGCHAGHGLTYESVVPLLNEGCFEEYNIGHWIIADSIFKGLGKVVSDFSVLFKKYAVKDI